MTSPSEIPEALKAKAREVADTIILEGANVRSLVGMQTIALALLQIRNEAIAEEREAILHAVAATAVQVRNHPDQSYVCVKVLAETIRARP